MITYFDGEFVEDEKASISVRSRALNYGLGCFGGIRAYAADDGKQLYLFRLDEHVARLRDSAKIIYLRLPGTDTDVRGIVTEVIRRNQIHYDVYVRPLLFNNSNKLAPIIREEDTSFTVFCIPIQRYIDKDSLDVCVSSWRRVQDNAIPARAKPTGIYLNSALARREAMDNGFDEAIFLTQSGKVAEGSAEHVFIVRQGVLYSPPSTADNLDGITRRSIITLAREDLKLEFHERNINRSELYVAEEMFLCGTGAQITPVRSVDRRVLGDGNIGPITQKLQQHYADVVRGRINHRHNWLTPVWT